VRIVLLEKGLSFEPVLVDLADRHADFVAVSPLGKVPTFVDEDGTVVFDSTVIAEYLEDRYPTPSVLGASWKERLSHRALDELGDTVADQAVAARVSAMRNDAAGEARAFALAEKALVEIDRRAKSDAWPSSFGLGHAAVIAALGYFELRHGRARIDPHAALVERVESLRTRVSVEASAK
jgi:glutathione S-transferase